jgi:regulator of sigma E protease
MLHPIAKWTSKKSGITYQLGILPLGGFVQIKGMNPFEDGAFEDPDSYQMQPAWKRFLVILAGPVANLVVAFLVFFGLFLAGAPEPSGEPVIGRTVEGAPADLAGLEAGDRVLQFNGNDVESWMVLAKALHGSPGEEVALLVERDGQRFEVLVTPADIDGTGKIGIDPTMVHVRLGLGQAVVGAAAKCAVIAAGTALAIYSLVSGDAGDVQAVGPVGIVKLAAGAIQSDAGQALDLFGFFSMMLFLFNLLPIPALDGGRGTILLVEAITRRRINRKADALINTTGFVIIIGLILVITFKEIFFG